MSILTIPKIAIKTFEYTHKLSICVHDLGGELWGILAPDQFVHGQAPCRAVKALDLSRSCIRHDVSVVRSVLPDFPEGRIHVCHGGFVEWMIPVFRRKELKLILFAGQRLPGKDLKAAMLITRRGVLKQLPKTFALPPKVHQAEADLILESMRQLGARLSMWYQEFGKVGGHTNLKKVRSGEQRKGREWPGRKIQIERFIFSNHTRPVGLEDLAESLALSVSRAGHLVKELFGESFVVILSRARLGTAAGLLRHSSLKISEIAMRSGFNDISHFHHRFRERFEMTPRTYRALGHV